MTDAAAPRLSGWALARILGATAVAVGSIVVTELSVVAVVLLLVAALSLPALEAKARRSSYLLIAVGAVAAAIGLTRFVLTKAAAGIAQGGQRAAGKSALWRLREIRIAEDGVRKEALWDPDGDGVGSAVLVTVLAGRDKARGREPLGRPLLNYRFRQRVETPHGPALRAAAHLFIVCLPRAGGGWTAQLGDPVDEELAERRFVAYAWPAEASVDVESVIFIDEHERILLLEDRAHGYRGPGAPPPCDAALDNAGSWRPWRDKRPRSSLPGEG